MRTTHENGFGDEPSGFDGALLDRYLGRLSLDEEAALQARMSADARLAADDEALSACFEALRAFRVPRTPPGLKDRVLARVAAASPALRVHAASKRRPPVDNRGFTPISLQSFRDIAAVAAVIVLMVGVGVPSVLHMRERNQRTVCSWNLGQIGQGLASYASTFGDSLPFAGWSSRSSWQPTSEPGVEVVPNRRHVFPLARNSFVPVRVFICPSTNDRPMPSGLIAARQDFLESRNISYASQNMAGVRPTFRADPDAAIMADDNPCFDSGMPLFDFARSIGLADPARSNSRAHGGAGQNLLTLGGAVKWATTPNAGVNGDNIWTLTHVLRYTGREGPQAETDSHLLK